MDIAIEQHTGSHRDLAWSFREADDSQELLDACIDLGQLWVARAAGGEVIGRLQVVPRDEEVWEAPTPPSPSPIAVGALVGRCWSGPWRWRARPGHAG